MQGLEGTTLWKIRFLASTSRVDHPACKGKSCSIGVRLHERSAARCRSSELNVCPSVQFKCLAPPPADYLSIPSNSEIQLRLLVARSSGPLTPVAGHDDPESESDSDLQTPLHELPRMALLPATLSILHLRLQLLCTRLFHEREKNKVFEGAFCFAYGIHSYYEPESLHLMLQSLAWNWGFRLGARSAMVCHPISTLATLSRSRRSSFPPCTL